jgi:UDP-N-acetylmuramyl tripeptide synthase
MKLLETLELIGPGRWLDRPHLQLRLQLDEAELELLHHRAQDCCDSLTHCLRHYKMNPEASPLSRAVADPAGTAALWLGQTAVLLQRRAGHRVRWASYLPDTKPGLVHALFEFEDLQTGRQAAELALQLLQQVLQVGESGIAGADTAASLAEFQAAAAQRVFPLDADILIAAATARDIPVCKLDREPYNAIVGDFRRRPNGLLRFGHGCYQQVVDGTLCLHRSARVLQQLGQNSAALGWLRQAGAPVTDRESISPLKQHQHYRFLCAGQQFLAAVDSNGMEVTDRCHSSWLEFVAQSAQQLEAGMLAFEVVCADLSQHLHSGSGAFIGLDISPQLDGLLPQADELCRLMADDFVSWMFPPASQSRIPLFSVTGTNGKTTTCRMLTRIASAAGFHVGLACTDGVYLNDQPVVHGDFSGSDGHHYVLEAQDIDLGVLETARGAVLHSGFVFDFSDVAVCTNVTPEHLGEYGINSIEQMAEIKRLIVAKARLAAVLNFDDRPCRRMGAELPVKRICWTSVNHNAEFILSQDLPLDRVICIEEVNGVEWIVSHQPGNREQLMPVNFIPASFNGTARHMLSNALQAMAAALEMNIARESIQQAMQAFSMGIDSTPGRLNLHEGAGFPVLLDFVQNLDAMRTLCEFTERQKISGRRILVLSVLGRHDDATVREFARYAAQYFDHFICRNYVKTYPHRSLEEIPQLLRTTLLQLGVPAENIQLILEEAPAIDAALKLAGAGDLVVIMCGIRPRENWQQISDFAEGKSTNLTPRPGRLL